jgi:hypothetical protein
MTTLNLLNVVATRAIAVETRARDVLTHQSSTISALDEFIDNAKNANESLKECLRILS